MSKKTIDEFIKELKENGELQQKLLKINTSDEESLIRILNEAGYDFTVEEWKKCVNQKSAPANGKLSDDQLNQVSGGLFHIDLCPKRFDSFLCQPTLGFIGGCSHIKNKNIDKKRVYEHENTEDYIDYHYRYCDLGYWDEETGKGF